MNTPIREIVEIGRRMSDRWMTNSAGGNISVRAGEQIYISPRYADYVWNWKLSPEDIVVGPINSDELTDNPSFSREGRAHLKIYRNFSSAQAIIHAHPFHVMPFCVAQKAIEPVLDATMRLGTIDLAKHAASGTQDLADNVVEGLIGKEELISDYAAAVLLPKHGIFIAGKDLYAAYDTLVKVDLNAWCILAQKML